MDARAVSGHAMVRVRQRVLCRVFVPRPASRLPLVLALRQVLRHLLLRVSRLPVFFRHRHLQLVLLALVLHLARLLHPVHSLPLARSC
jgi:hypothetical protein